MYYTQKKGFSAKPKYRPAVKFRNIDESVLQTVQTGARSAAEGDAMTEGEDEFDDDESDDEMDTSMDGPPRQAFAFEIDVDIDIDSKALQDMVAVDPVVREEVQPQQGPKPAQQAPQAPNWDW
jgi:hypothetical protein